MLDLLFEGRQADLALRLRELAVLPRPDRGVVAALEAEVASDPAAHLTFDANGTATLTSAAGRFHAGRFAVRSIGSLRAEASARREGREAPVRFSVLAGADPLTDIGLLQATAAPGTLFQVASQFNALESPSPGVVPVHRYFWDPTQGPRASISAFPGTFGRHYAAPAADGTRFVQTSDRQLDLLADALPSALGRVRGGYLTSYDLSDLRATAAALEQNFDAITVGVHDDVEVVLGANWDGPVVGSPRIAQVFTSTYAGGGYSGSGTGGEALPLCGVLLRAAYAGTLFAAAAMGKRTVVLTMIGGGVFGNPHPLIWEAILGAVDQVRDLVHVPLHIVLNGREVDETLGRKRLVEATRERGGMFVRVREGRLLTA